MHAVQFFLCALLLGASTVASGADPMSFRLAEPETADGATPGWIVADGDITADSANNFRGFLKDKQLGERSVVLLNSPGGSLFGGVALGEAIRELGLGTRIGRSVPDAARQGGFVFETESPGVCLSACAFAFLGGKWRTAADRTLGVHQHYSEIAMQEPTAKQFTAGDLSAQQIISGLLAEYVVRMGVDARFLTRASMTEPRSIYLFTTKEMEQFGITLNDLAFSPWSFDPYKFGLIAVSKTINSDYIATLFCRKDTTLRLSVIRPFYGTDKDLKDAINASGVFLFGTEIPSSNIKGTMSSRDRATFEFTLPSQVVAGKITDSSGMGAIGAFRQLFYFDIPEKDFATYARLVGRNCI